jgi:hypothetical protein
MTLRWNPPPANGRKGSSFPRAGCIQAVKHALIPHHVNGARERAPRYNLQHPPWSYIHTHAYKFILAVLAAVSCALSVESRFDPTSVGVLLELELLSGSVLRRPNT